MSCLKGKSCCGFKSLISNGLWKVIGKKLFFVSTLVQRRHNKIERIRLDHSEWVVSRNDISLSFMDCFNLVHYEDSRPHGVDLSHLINPSISPEDKAHLIRIPNDVEIHDVLFCIGAFKALGPDGMPTVSIKLIGRLWDRILSALFTTFFFQVPYIRL